MSCQCQSLGSTAPTPTDLELFGRLGYGRGLVHAAVSFGLSYLISTYLFKQDTEWAVTIGALTSGMTMARVQGARAEYTRHVDNPLR